MNRIIESIENTNNLISSIVWGAPMLILILGTGIYFTVKTRFFQLANIRHIFQETFIAIFTKKSVTKSKDKKSITQFQSISTALASTIGTGNITGVATAIAIGGPGAVFWMWLSAFFGMMTIYAENVLGIYFRKKNSAGEWSGGPMYYLEEGLKQNKRLSFLAKPLAVLFSFFCIFASFGCGNMTQVNSISNAFSANFEIPPIVTGIVIAVMAALVIIGGIGRIGKVTEKLVPFMAIMYMGFTLMVFLMNFDQIPYVFSSIFTNAFSFLSIAGGAGGIAIKRAVSMGFRRGVFSNEAGLGSSVLVHSSSNVKEPVIQGMWGIFQVFVDTIILCTLTAFVLLSSPTDAVSIGKAFQNISTEKQYFTIFDGESYNGNITLIDKNANEMIKQSNKKESSNIIKGRTAYGQEIEIALDSSKKGESNYTYTNVMAIKGIPKKDSQGNVLHDKKGNPIITSVSITPVTGVELVTYALSQRFGSFSGKLISISVFLFAFATVIGWSFYGTKSIEYLFGPKYINLYKVVYILLIVVGSTMELDLVWNIADTLNALMAIPNLIGILLLSGFVFKITDNYRSRKLNKHRKLIIPMLSAYRDIQEEQEIKVFEEE